jgi:ribosomal-protein-alanine N-acetyltransferase
VRDIELRPMCVDDLDHVVANETRSYAYPWTRGIFADCLNAGHECWVVQMSRDVIGHGVLSIAAGEAHLLNVCVRRDEQGHGYGRQLVRHMLDRALARGADVVFLEVRPSNHVAGALYESLGFNEIGRRKNYYPAAYGHEDARVLAIQLRLNGETLYR